MLGLPTRRIVYRWQGPCCRQDCTGLGSVLFLSRLTMPTFRDQTEFCTPLLFPPLRSCMVPREWSSRVHMHVS